MSTMTAGSQSEAQKRADDIRAFQEELARLENAGVLMLAPDQRDALAAYHGQLLSRLASDYDIDRDPQAKRLSLGMRIASFLGALALAASVFFLFYQFWGLFNTTTQASLLIGAAIGSLLVTMLVRRMDASGYFTKLAAMVAFACFVLNIAMFGQIFNITPSDKALLPWALFAFLLAYACQLRLLLAAGILCIAAFIAARTGTWSGIYWLDFGERPENFIPAAVLLFCIPQWFNHARFSGFAQIYRVFGLLCLLLPILVLSHWGSSSYLPWTSSMIEGSYQLLGFLFSAGAIWLGTRRHWSDTVNTGITFFVIFLYTKFFDWWWEIMPKYLFFLLMGMSAVLLLLVLRRLRGATIRVMRGGPA
jgi:uncharacterized membrane protein